MTRLQKIQWLVSSVAAISCAYYLGGWPAFGLAVGLYGCSDVALDIWAKRRGS